MARDRPHDLGLEDGRKAYRERAWTDAHALLSRVDEQAPLGAEDLERLAMSAYLTNRDADCLRALERCHHAFLGEGESARAVRAAFWLGFRLATRGETGPATGWFSRGRRVLDGLGADCAERGYLLVPRVEERLSQGDPAGAFEAAAEEAGIARRFQDTDLLACALHQQGRALIRNGEVEAGLSLLDEAMVAVVAGEVSPLMSGHVYCSVILACREVFAFGRSRQWTDALARWCDTLPQMIAFTGSCRVHRAEIMQLCGAWRDAIEEAGQACARFRAGIDPQPPARAYYQRGEMHRLRGAFAAAEADYRRASRFGCEPQPGLALLRLAQGRTRAAAAAIRRALITADDPADGARLRGQDLGRARLLPAQVEIALATGEVEEAERACRELEQIAAGMGRGVPEAIAAQARGAVLLARGDAAAALGPLRRALEVWQEIAAPYEGARVRLLVGLACRALGDADGAGLELAAARAIFDALGAKPDVARLDAILAGRHPGACHGLTARELQVLRQVAAGKTNAAIAAELFLSERTVERHLSNIFVKLDLSTRAAATAWAYEHDLV
jgi:DNA-binding CsgD family transcriptional regulator